jgi:sugar O-acyltransferase (sialic acid O-acetyltransferase NeuD family)
MSAEPVVVIGAGGHGKVVVSTLLAAGFRVPCVFDDDREKWGSEILGVPVQGPVSVSDEVEHRRLAILGIGQNEERQRFAEALNLNWATVVHPRAWVHPSVRLGVGTVVFAGAIIQPGTVIGRHVIVNTGALIDHDCEIGDYAHVAPGVKLSGGVRLGEGVFLGIGSCAIPGVRVGEWTTVGAGAAVVDDLPSKMTAVGVPARELERKGGR